MRGRDALLVTAKIVATVILVAAVGFGAGRGLAEVTGDSASATPPPQTAAPAKPPADAEAPRRADPTIGVEVTFAGLRPASTPRGRARDRARLRVGLRVRNRSEDRVTIDRPRIQVGEDTVAVDTNAAELAGEVLEELAPGSSAKGELRFETEGAVTRKLMEQRRTTLRIAGRKIRVPYDVGPPLPQPSEESPSGSTTTTAP